MYSAAKSEELKMWCRHLEQPSANGRQQAKCEFIGVTVTPPKTPQEVEQDIARLAHEARETFADPAKIKFECAKALGPVPSGPTSEEQQELVSFNSALAKSCGAKSADALIDYLSVTMRRAPRSCNISLDYEPDRAVLEQIDTNTWQAIEPPDAGNECHSTLIRTLWRPAGTIFGWNYREIRTMPENVPQRCKDYLKSYEYTGVGSPRQSWNLGCDWITFPD
jgi:hypothetical protein